MDNFERVTVSVKANRVENAVAVGGDTKEMDVSNYVRKKHEKARVCGCLTMVAAPELAEGMPSAKISLDKNHCCQAHACSATVILAKTNFSKPIKI